MQESMWHANMQSVILCFREIAGLCYLMHRILLT